ncbi:MAG: NAD-dependent dehydratase [Proteobacteria bacterium]|nr:MAG: NAD-dependent dehydratase [Pseudomonadota bacterium]
MKNAADVVAADLELLCGALRDELPALGGERLLVVGGAGFLGHYLVQTALHWNRTAGAAKPIRVTVWDSYARGVPRWLEALRGDPHLECVRHDITQPLPADMPDFRWVFHAASIASPTYYRRHPIETMDANVGGLRRLLDWADAQRGRGRPAGGLVFFSSSEIYGDPSPDEIPTRETYRGFVSCTGPRACYDESKRYGETLCVNFARTRGVPVKIARPFNNVGPGLKISDRRVLPDFARDVLAGRDIVMLSDGGPKRTFCYVADAVAGYYKILVRGGPGEPYNVGTEAPEISIGELAERVAALARELFGYRGRVVREKPADGEYLTDNPARRCPSIEKARAQLGYEPQVPLDEALRRSLLWYRDHREGDDA